MAKSKKKRARTRGPRQTLVERVVTERRKYALGSVTKADRAWEDVQEAWAHNRTPIGRHVGAGVYSYRGLYYHIGTGKPERFDGAAGTFGGVVGRLKTETGTAAMERRIRRAFKSLHPDMIDPTFEWEHGQWWVIAQSDSDDNDEQVTYSVVDAEGPGSEDGFSFEEDRAEEASRIGRRR